MTQAQLPERHVVVALVRESATRDASTFTHGIPGCSPAVRSPEEAVAGASDYIDAGLKTAIHATKRADAEHPAWRKAATPETGVAAACWAAAKFHGTSLTVQTAAPAMLRALLVNLHGVGEEDAAVAAVVEAEHVLLDACGYDLAGVANDTSPQHHQQ